MPFRARTQPHAHITYNRIGLNWIESIDIFTSLFIEMCISIIFYSLGMWLCCAGYERERKCKFEYDRDRDWTIYFHMSIWVHYFIAIGRQMRNTGLCVVIVLPIFIAAMTTAHCIVLYTLSTFLSLSVCLWRTIYRFYTQSRDRISKQKRERERDVEIKRKVVMNLFHFGYWDLMR